jgi:choline dehydrogenase-like flavoprotein
MTTAARLAAVYRTLAPMTAEDARRRAEVALETIAATSTRADRLMFGWALQGLDNPVLNWLTGAGWTRFRTANLATRQGILVRWAESRIPQQRTAFQAWKRLGLFLAYADPGPDPSRPANPGWARIGYAPAERPAQVPPPSLAPLEVDRTARSMLELEADVVVVGSGAGGGVVAARLAAAGRSVLVVESGPYVAEADMPTLEAHAYRDLYLDRGTTSTADLSMTILAGHVVGGGTTVNWTTSIPPPPRIRHAWAREHGLEGFDDASADDDLVRLGAELDLREPTTIPPKDRLILDGARALGWEAGLTRRNAGPCTECGACAFGCARGSKRSGPRAHLAAAAGAGARVLVDARVQRLTHAGGRVEGVEGRLRGGRPFRARAARVVIAAGALRTPLLIERSGIAHAALGRNLRLHPVVALAARLAEPVDMWLGPSQAARSLQFAEPGATDPDGIGPEHGGFIIEAPAPHPGLAAGALPWTGRDASHELLGQMRGVATLIGILPDGAGGGGRVRLAAGGRARIDYRLDAATANGGKRALVEMARLARAGGAVEAFSIATPAEHWSAGGPAAAFERFLRRLADTDMRPNRVSLFSAHQMGTARAGEDPATHQCDPHGRLRLDRSGRLLRGCYVADASLFPTAVGVNPMLTVMLMAERTARAVLADS